MSKQSNSAQERGTRPNILFIMADQLRADYLASAGHPHIKTPVLDELGGDAVSFSRAYTQGPVCGPSRMSFYTGRYVASHGSSYNNIPLRVGEWTLGDWLRPLGYRVALVGKTHATADLPGIRRLGLDPANGAGKLVAQAGFEPFERDDGLHPPQSLKPDLRYNNWLRELGYDGDNPWHDHANSGLDANGASQSGWYMRNSRLAARVQEEHSETAYMTDRAMAFIGEAGDDPWCLHLSYIKPHWPYIAPSPYHHMYGLEDVVPVVRSETERAHSHPVIHAYQRHEESVNFARDEVRNAVIPTYMGLITQLDKHLGRLFSHLKSRGLWERTVIVFTSDHGDYLGDHYLGEKDLFHDCSARLPLIIRSPFAAADKTRGSVCDRLVQGIDLVPSFVDWAGGEPAYEFLEGRSLRQWVDAGDFGGTTVHSEADPGAVYSECDYALRHARHHLDVAVDKARAWMVRSERFKYIYYEGFEPQLFDMVEEPGEMVDLGRDPGFAAVRNEHRERLLEWLRGRRSRTTLSDAEVAARTGKARQRGYIFGAW